eukprot:gene5494-7699_t
MVLRDSKDLSKLQKDLEDRNKLLEDIIGNTPDEKKGEFVKALEVSFGLWREDVDRREQEVRKREQKMREAESGGKQAHQMDITKMLKVLGETEQEKRKRKAAESLAEKMQLKANRLEKEKDSLKNEVTQLKRKIEDLSSEKGPKRAEKELQSSKAAQAAATRKAEEEKVKLEQERAKTRKIKKDSEQQVKDLKAKIVNLEQQNTKLGNSLLGTVDKDIGELRKRVMQLEGENADIMHKMEDCQQRVNQRGLIITKKNELITKMEQAKERKDKLIVEKSVAILASNQEAKMQQEAKQEAQLR